MAKRGPHPKKKAPTVVMESVPRSSLELAWRRVRPLMEASFKSALYFDKDFLRTVACSCYLQGSTDTLQLIDSGRLDPPRSFPDLDYVI